MLQSVREVKHKLDGVRLEFECQACILDPPSMVILFYVTKNNWHHEEPEIRIPRGTLGFSYYWFDRNYNVYHWLHPDGRTIGYYFNIARHTSIHTWGVEWEDLEVDYWLSAEGDAGFLDEEDLPATLASDLRELVAEVKTYLSYHARIIAVEIEVQTGRIMKDGLCAANQN